MKNKWLVEQKLEEWRQTHDADRNEEDYAWINALEWVLESPDCPFCAHRNRKDWELQIFHGNITPPYLEAKYAWEDGIVEEHMTAHMDYDPEEAVEVEKARSEAITTLDMANDVFSRITKWLDEWELQKDADGIDAEWLSTATRLVAQANTNIKLIGTLKKEIGVDSQMMLASQQVNGVMGILVDTLRNEPRLLNQIEMRIGALKPPSNDVQDADWEVID